MANKTPSLFNSLLPVLLLISLLTINIQYVFKDTALDGAIQLSLLISAAFAGIIAYKNGDNWKSLEKGIVKSISIAIPSILILLLIGAVAGSWLIAGIIPTLVYYGLEFIHPNFFLVSCCISCSIVSLITGTSYATIATIGVALLSIGTVFGISAPIIAGAIISGAYFGDKLSPLSDTTNLAPTIAGGELFKHIKFMLWTTIPSLTISLILFQLLSNHASFETFSTSKIFIIQQEIEEKFTISALLLIVPLITFILIIKKVQAIPALSLSILLACLSSIFFQANIINELSSVELNGWKSIYVSFKAIYGNITIETNIEELKRLFSTGGMSGMLNTIWLILCAMIFGGIMEKAGFLNTIGQTLVKYAKNNTSLISATAFSSIVMNFIASDQYVSIILPGKMFKKSYEEKGLRAEALSRTLEDAGTVTSVLIPWNTCGITQATVMGVLTLEYAPYCFFCWLSPIITILFSIIQKKQLVKS